jgi:hypothetical protein
MGPDSVNSASPGGWPHRRPRTVHPGVAIAYRWGQRKWVRTVSWKDRWCRWRSAARARRRRPCFCALTPQVAAFPPRPVAARARAGLGHVPAVDARSDGQGSTRALVRTVVLYVGSRSVAAPRRWRIYFPPVSFYARALATATPRRAARAWH